MKRKWCTTCELWRPTTASHCSQCKRCIYGHDHHCGCVYTPNTIGFPALHMSNLTLLLTHPPHTPLHLSTSPPDLSTSSSVHLFTSSPLHLFTSSPLHLFTSSPLHLFTLSYMSRVVGNCIGQYNHHWFCLLLLCSAVACTCASMAVYLHVQRGGDIVER